jgi:hypothetical protein
VSAGPNFPRRTLGIVDDLLLAWFWERTQSLGGCGGFRPRLAVAGLLLFVVSFVAGCSDRHSGSAVTLKYGCPTHAALISGRLFVQGRAFGDVTGDGRKEEVFVEVARRAPVHCRYFLVMRSLQQPARMQVQPIPLSSLQGFQPLSAASAALGFLADVDPVRGAELVLAVGYGGTVTFIGLFTFRHGMLHQLRAPRALGSVLRIGASGAGGAMIDCVRQHSGRLFVVFTERRDKGFTARRHELVLRGFAFHMVRTHRSAIHFDEAWPPPIATILDGSAFHSCIVARSR